MNSRLQALLDAQQRDAIARRVFAEWASAQAGAPVDAAALVQSSHIEDEYVGLLSTTFHGSRSELQNVTCDACHGSGNVGCPRCAAAGTVVCPICNGARKAYGHAANGAYRLLNCTHCKGKGALDCPDCRRGVARCPTCSGERRVLRWVVKETWSRSEHREHPQGLAQRFQWSGADDNMIIERDGAIVADVERDRELLPGDIGAVPLQWLAQFARPRDGERIGWQRLRIVRVPRLVVTYDGGRAPAEATFTGLALRPDRGIAAPFRARAARIRNGRVAIGMAGAIVAIAWLARGAFYWNPPSYAAIAFWSASLLALSRFTRRWSAIAGALFLIALLFGGMALPSPKHVQQAIALGQLDAAEDELRALGDSADPSLQADLQLARLRGEADLERARALLAGIAAGAPQHRAGSLLIDRLLIDEATRRIMVLQPRPAADLLAQVSAASHETEPFANAVGMLRSRARDATAHVRALTLPETRLDGALAAERLWVAYEIASRTWGAPELVQLRTEMARDVAALERRARRRKSG